MGCLFFLEAGCDLDDEVGVGEGFLDGFGGEVAAVLADGGEDFMRDPTTERLSFGLVATDDDFVQACLVHKEGFLPDTSIIEDLTLSKVLRIQAASYPRGVPKIKCVADVFEDEPGLTLLIRHDADVVAEVVPVRVDMGGEVCL